MRFHPDPFGTGGYPWPDGPEETEEFTDAEPLPEEMLCGHGYTDPCPVCAGANPRGAEYAAWIEAFVSAQPNRFVRGKCAEATLAMIEAFPELRRAAGFVHCTWGRDQHFWCVTPDGTVVDPTAEQFRAVFEYEELDLDDPETQRRIPTGRCLDCGDDVYEGKSFCSEACEASTRAYLNGPREVF